MRAYQGQASVVTALLGCGAKADTAAGTSGWVDVRGYEGDIVIISIGGTVTAGSLTPTIEDATASDGTGGAAFTGLTAFTVGTSSNDPLVEKRTFRASATRGFIRYVGTIVTGPVDLAVIMLATPKYTS